MGDGGGLDGSGRSRFCSIVFLLSILFYLAGDGEVRGAASAEISGAMTVPARCPSGIADIEDWADAVRLIWRDAGCADQDGTVGDKTTDVQSLLSKIGGSSLLPLQPVISGSLLAAIHNKTQLISKNLSRFDPNFNYAIGNGGGKIKESSPFYKEIFESDVVIKNVIIKGGLDFSYATFRKGLEITNVIVKGDLVLDRVSVAGVLKLENVAVSKVVARRMVANGDVTLSNLFCEEGCKLENSSVGGRLRLAGGDRVPPIGGSDADAPPGWREEKARAMPDFGLLKAEVGGAFEVLNSPYSAITLDQGTFAGGIAATWVPGSGGSTSVRSLASSTGFEGCARDVGGEPTVLRANGVKIGGSLQVRSVRPVDLLIERSEIADDVVVGDCQAWVRRGPNPVWAFSDDLEASALAIRNTRIGGGVDLSTATALQQVDLRDTSLHKDLVLIRCLERSPVSEAGRRVSRHCESSRIQFGRHFKGFDLNRFTAQGIQDRSDIWHQINYKYSLNGLLINELPELLGQSFEFNSDRDDYIDQRVHWLHKQRDASLKHVSQPYKMLASVYQNSGNHELNRRILFEERKHLLLADLGGCSKSAEALGKSIGYILGVGPYTEAKWSDAGGILRECSWELPSSVPLLALSWISNGFGFEIWRPILYMVIIFMITIILCYKYLKYPSDSGGERFFRSVKYTIERTIPKLSLKSNVDDAAVPLRLGNWIYVATTLVYAMIALFAGVKLGVF